MPSVEVQRNAGHPWDGRKGFDLMAVDFDTERERDESVKAAEAKFWKPWIVGFNSSKENKPSAVFYKPSGLNKPWDDGPKNPHPGCVNGVELAPDPVPYPNHMSEREGS